MRKTYTFRDLPIKVNGRHIYTDTGALALNWSASGFEMNFSAERVNINFVPDYRADQPCYLGVFLDGKRLPKFVVTTGAETLMIEDIPAGEHHLRIVKLSEGDRLLKFETLELVGDDPVILPPPEYKLRFEFLGDSITCGYGDIADSGFPVFRTRDEDTTRTYAYLTAARFGADIRVEAVSGQGIVHACSGEVGYRVPEFFEHELRQVRDPHDFSSWTPDVLVINAGTNDGGPTSLEDFEVGADKFLTRVREVYPDTQVIWLYGMMGNKFDGVLDRVIKAKNDPKLHYLPTADTTPEAGEKGAVGHPNEKGQSRVAYELTAFISKLL